ncbi:PAS domain S-box protein [Candidatus Symbiobacter mobilis]|uniref:PAS/PAC domain protein n=1 Tax=Candidatus Symbiobacter mobilis CR TaxID=946483 RepID=U5NAS9_9BURK|nr:PAS domain S-box protein [Candidatus Symbiobacter mobilis]AGX88681.1 PAS/PAC domain protein [Candidatus Symbiobacter mobilis CR]
MSTPDLPISLCRDLDPFSRRCSESSAGLAVLVIEDEPGDYALIASYLRHLCGPNHSEPRIEWAKTLAQGVGAATRTRFDVVLLDLSLTDSSGLTTVATVTAAVAGTPVVVLTGHDDDALAMAAIAAGAQDYLVKGEIDSRSLGRAVRYALARSGLESQLQLFEVALHSAANGVIITDIDGRIEWVNRAFIDMTGYDLDESLHHRPGELLHSGKQPTVFYERMWNTILAGKVWSEELVNRRKNGSYYDEHMAISPVRMHDASIRYFVAIKQDVTARRQAQQRLEQSEERLDLALLGSDLGMWDMYPATGTLYLSAKAYEILGLPPNGAREDAGWFEDLLHPDDAGPRRDALEAHLRGDTQDYHVEFRMHHQNGHWVWLRLRGKIVARNADGTPLRVAGTMQDISLEKRLKLEGSDLLLRIESMIGQLGSHAAMRPVEPGPPIALSRRQRDVLALVARGMTSMQIASQLHISTATAATHRRDLMRKLDLHSVAELTRYAIDHKIVPPIAPRKR